MRLVRIKGGNDLAVISDVASGNAINMADQCSHFVVVFLGPFQSLYVCQYLDTDHNHVLLHVCNHVSIVNR